MQSIDDDDRSYIRLNVKVDDFLPVASQERAAMALKGKQCRFCEIKVTSTTVATRGSVKMTVEEFNKKTPLDIANQFYLDEVGHAMSDKQQEMFNYICQLVEEENRQ